ncbi:hypothetical protein CP981_26520 [Streptomyces platensis]|uniref:SH3b domain-containing protein n=1 Tax=Streptomyces platensis TaxID=58346 RepID=A0AAE6NKZ1_STRPT|nr:hypothetical protein [Streptomyces platensis]OSY47660.1 hypothetical protein BG653_00915 [Streptomyces platensis]QEV54717.1 hypothetical protein CP981_26520 [Streptomyces platensis]
MFPKSKSGTFGTFALCFLSGALAGVLAAGPALAANDPEGDELTEYEGRVVAKEGLVLRTGPSTEFRAIGLKEYGSVVGISCRLNGQLIEDNPVWYKLSDASYVWSSTRHIVNDGEDPRWC